MITDNELIKIGAITKPHGIKGEMTASLDYDIDLSELKCIVVPVDNIYVPFFINGVRPKSAENVILSIDGISNEIEAKELCGLPYYALLSDVDIEGGLNDEGGYISDFVGYEIYDTEMQPIGRISDYDDTTENVLFHVTTPEDKLLFIPVAADLIKYLDTDKHAIVMDLPDGLIDMQH